MPASLCGAMGAMAYNNAWANHRLHSACAALSQAEFEAPRAGFFPSLKATLNHILIIDWFYVDALEGGSLGPAAWRNPLPCATLSTLAAEQATVDRRLITFCEALSEASLNGISRVHRGDKRAKRAHRPAVAAPVSASGASSRAGPCHAERNLRRAAAARRVLFRR